VVVTILLAPDALAEKPGFGDTWLLRAGGMNQTANISFSLTRNDRPETSLDLGDLGMDDNASTFWGSLTWQFADSWGMSLTYSSFSTDGVETATDGGNFGDVEWSADAILTSEYDLDLYIIDLRWHFINTGRSHLGVGAGLHIADIGLGMGFRLDGIVNGETVVVDSGSETVSATAPLPNISLLAGHRFGDSVYLAATIGYFALKVDEIDGELVSARAGLEWRPTRHVGAGIGFQYLDINFDEDKGDRRLELDTESYGPVLFLSVGF
jgi:hypothetical protein